jgi:hypothetical protein
MGVKVILKRSTYNFAIGSYVTPNYVCMLLFFCVLEINDFKGRSFEH